MRSLIAVVLSSVILAPSAGEAVERYGYASVVVGDALTSSTFNSTGRGVEIDRSEASRGVVTVTFRGLAAVATGGHVQVSSEGPHVNYCKVVNWARRSPDTVVRVACFEPDGRPETGAFRFDVLLLADVVEEGDVSFAWASQPTTPSYTADSRFAFNADRGPITIRRLEVGRWQVRVPGMARRPGSLGNVQVSGYGTDNARCGLNFWLPIEGTNDLSVAVECFGGDGQPRDTRFTLLVVHPQGLDRMQKAWTWSPNSRTPPLPASSQYAHNSVAGGTAGVGTGDHRIFTPFGLGFPRSSIVLTTGYRAGPGGFCKTRSFSERLNRAATPLDHEHVYDPMCLTSAGVESSAGYSVLALTGEFIPFRNSERIVTLVFQQVAAFSGDGDCGDKVELFTRSSLTGRTTARIDTEDDELSVRPRVAVTPPWGPLRVDLSGGTSTFTAHIELWENDDFLCGGDQLYDIKPGPGETLNLTFDMARRLVFDDERVIGSIENSLTTKGETRDQGSLTFRTLLQPPL